MAIDGSLSRAWETKGGLSSWPAWNYLPSPSLGVPASGLESTSTALQEGSKNVNFLVVECIFPVFPPYFANQNGFLDSCNVFEGYLQLIHGVPSVGLEGARRVFLGYQQRILVTPAESPQVVFWGSSQRVSEDPHSVSRWFSGYQQQSSGANLQGPDSTRGCDWFSDLNAAVFRVVAASNLLEWY